MARIKNRQLGGTHMENLGTTILAVGALGTASFGIVEALKWTFVGILGFGEIKKLLGAPVMEALRLAYGADFMSFLKAQYRNARKSGELSRTIRQGTRVGLTPETAPGLAVQMGVVDGQLLSAVAAAIQSGEELNDEQRNLLGRFELALDARIDAALALANDRYIGYVRFLASAVSIIIAIVVGNSLGIELTISLIVGVAAVPVAPMAKDLTSAIRAASKAMTG